MPRTIVACLYSSSDGLSRRIIVAWHKELGDMHFAYSDGRVVFRMITLAFEPARLLGAGCANPNGFQWKNLWQEVQVAQTLDISMMNFNYIMSAKEKWGEPFYVNRDIREFWSFLHQSGLIDPGVYRSRFTWCNNRLDLFKVWERLDKTISTDS